MDPRTKLTIGLILTLTAVTLGYIMVCWIWPFKPCRRCSGTGRRRSPTGRAVRLCRPCRGTGRRLRAGRWIHNQISHARREANR